MSTKQEQTIDEREEGEIIDEFEDIISSDEEFSMRKRIEELEAKNAELEIIANISVSAAYSSGGYNDYPKKDPHHHDRYPLVSIDISDDEVYPPAPKMIGSRITKRRKSIQQSSSRHKLLHSNSSSHRRRKYSSSPPPAPSYRQSDKLLLSLFHDRLNNSHSSKRKRKAKKTHSNKSSRGKSRESYATDNEDNYTNIESCIVNADDNRVQFNSSDCDESYSINRDELRVALARNTHRIESHASLKDRLCRKNNLRKSSVENSPPPEAFIVEEVGKIEPPTKPSSPVEEKGDSDNSLEEQELRILALKSAVIKKHMVRKKRNENAAYSPSDFDEIYRCISKSPSLNNLDQPEECNSMEISPVSSPKMILSDDGGIDTKPVDMDIVDSDSECELPSYDKWIPIEQIPLPSIRIDEKLYNPTPLRYDNDEKCTMPPDVRFERASVSPKNQDSDVDEEELALRAFLLSKMNSPKVNRIVKTEPPLPKFVKVQTPDPDISLEAEALRNSLLNNMKKKLNPNNNNSPASVLKEAVRRLTGQNASPIPTEIPIHNTYRERFSHETNKELNKASISLEPKSENNYKPLNFPKIRLRNIETLRDSQKFEVNNSDMQKNNQGKENSKENPAAGEYQMTSAQKLQIINIDSKMLIKNEPLPVTQTTSKHILKSVSSHNNATTNVTKPFVRNLAVKVQRMNSQTTTCPEIATKNVSKKPGCKKTLQLKDKTNATAAKEYANDAKEVLNTFITNPEPVNILLDNSAISLVLPTEQISEHLSVQNKNLEPPLEAEDAHKVLEVEIEDNQDLVVVVDQQITDLSSDSTKLATTSQYKNEALPSMHLFDAKQAEKLEDAKINHEEKKNVELSTKLKITDKTDKKKLVQTSERAEYNLEVESDAKSKPILIASVQKEKGALMQSIPSPDMVPSTKISQVKVQVQEKKGNVPKSSSIQKGTKIPIVKDYKPDKSVISTALTSQQKILPSKLSLSSQKTITTQMPRQQPITTRTKIIKPNKVINQQTVDLKRKTVDNLPQNAVSVKKPKIEDTNRLITKAEIPKVPELVIQLRVSESESEYSELSATDVDENYGAGIENNFSKNFAICNEYCDIASPISLPMESPCDTPIRSGSPINCRTQTPQPTIERTIVNNCFQVELEQFLKNVRSKVLSAPKSIQLMKGKEISASNSTPVAVRHLPEASQQEYRRLISRMKMLERQKQAKSDQPLANSSDSGLSDSKASLSDGSNKFLVRKVLVKNAAAKPLPSTLSKIKPPEESDKTVEKPLQKQTSPKVQDNKTSKASKEHLLVLYENSYRKTGSNIICNLDKSLELVIVAKKAKMAKLKHEQRLRELRKEMEEVQIKLKEQQEKITKIYPEICSSHRMIESLKTRRQKINQVATSLGKSVIGSNYSMLNDQKQIISEKSKKLAAEIKFVNTMKLSDVIAQENRNYLTLPENAKAKNVIASAENQKSTIIEKLVKENSSISSENNNISSTIEKEEVNNLIEEQMPAHKNDTQLIQEPPSITSTTINENEVPTCDTKNSKALNTPVPEDTNDPMNNTIVPEIFSNEDETACSTTNGHEEALELAQPVAVDDNKSNNNEQSPVEQKIMDENNEEENGGEKVGSAKLQDYVSPLSHLRDERNINPNGVVCPYQLMGQCDDKDCKYMHLED